VEELQGFLARGQFKSVKMRIGAANGTVANSVARVRAAREGLGNDIAIMCDADGTFNVAEAKRFCRKVEDANIDWLEEPPSSDDFRGLVDIRAATDIPIATGERESTRFPFREPSKLRATDVLQPDPAIVAGITELMRIEAIGSAF
jgi:L-alanine-DL-glutamate epimerase-like enolase superfamily enzyme